MMKEKFEREKAYQITLYIVRKMIQEGMLTEDEVRRIDAFLNEKYTPLMGCLYA